MATNPAHMPHGTVELGQLETEAQWFRTAARYGIIGASQWFHGPRGPPRSGVGAPRVCDGLAPWLEVARFSLRRHRAGRRLWRRPCQGSFSQLRHRHDRTRLERRVGACREGRPRGSRQRRRAEPCRPRHVGCGSLHQRACRRIARASLSTRAVSGPQSSSTAAHAHPSFQHFSRSSLIMAPRFPETREERCRSLSRGPLGSLPWGPPRGGPHLAVVRWTPPASSMQHGVGERFKRGQGR